MKIFSWGKDGGPESVVSGFWLVEIKWLFSIAILRFGNGSRENFHSHAFNSISWLVNGTLEEQFTGFNASILYKPSFLPILTKRSTIHRVVSFGTSWVITFRGPWSKRWLEWNPNTGRYITLTHGRKVVGQCPDTM